MEVLIDSDGLIIRGEPQIAQKYQGSRLRNLQQDNSGSDDGSDVIDSLKSYYPYYIESWN